MANAKEFFLNITQRLFSNWTALKMAVEHGMGSKERAVNFCPYVTELMYMNENLSSEDIAIELEEYMDSEFQTELQDNSAIQVAQQLLKFYRYCADGNEAVALAEMEKLPSMQNWILTREEIKKNKSMTVYEESKANSDDDDDDDDKRMETCEDEDWIEVRTRRKE